MAKDKEFPTLFDRVMASCFEPNQPGAFHTQQELKVKLFQARRFVLDDTMSTFLGDLATAAFKKLPNREAQHTAIEAMRAGARLPHKVTWIEYNLRKCHEQMRTYGTTIIHADGKPLDQSELWEIPKLEGWLLEQHPKIETAFRMTLFVYSDDCITDKNYNMWAFPWAYLWNTTDDPLPWKGILKAEDYAETQGKLSSLITGLLGYYSEHVSVVCADKLMTTNDKTWMATLNLLREWGGTVRRVWSLLATINDLPIIRTQVKPTKGYMAGRNYRKFLEHTVIKLTVPVTRYKALARSVVAKARRRAHQVRGHWRLDRWHPPAALCQHIYTAHDDYLECSICKGRKIWITEHQRGDANLGFVTHDYHVEYKPEQPHDDI